jgi:hypothetical protein
MCKSALLSSAAPDLRLACLEAFVSMAAGNSAAIRTPLHRPCIEKRTWARAAAAGGAALPQQSLLLIGIQPNAATLMLAMMPHAHERHWQPAGLDKQHFFGPGCPGLPFNKGGKPWPREASSSIAVGSKAGPSLPRPESRPARAAQPSYAGPGPPPHSPPTPLDQGQRCNSKDAAVSAHAIAAGKLAAVPTSPVPEKLQELQMEAVQSLLGLSSVSRPCRLLLFL